MISGLNLDSSTKMRAYEKNGELTSILFPREYMRARVVEGLGSNWTEARLAMFFSGIDSGDNNAPVVEENVPVQDNSDYLTFGLKDFTSQVDPGDAGSLFLGMRSTGLTSTATAQRFADSTGSCSAVGCDGTTIVNGGVLQNGALAFPSDPSGIEAFNGFYCLKLKIFNRGTGSQFVRISASQNSPVTGSDYSKARLLNMTQNASFGLETSVTWNSGGSARSIPNAAWVRLPFYLSRIRIQAFIAIKVSP